MFETPCNKSTLTPQKARELKIAYVINLEKVTTTPHHNEPSTLPLEINTVKKGSTTLDVYGKSKEDQEVNIAKKIKAVKRSII